MIQYLIMIMNLFMECIIIYKFSGINSKARVTTLISFLHTINVTSLGILIDSESDEHTKLFADTLVQSLSQTNIEITKKCSYESDNIDAPNCERDLDCPDGKCTLPSFNTVYIL